MYDFNNTYLLFTSILYFSKQQNSIFSKKFQCNNLYELNAANTYRRYCLLKVCLKYYSVVDIRLEQYEVFDV